MLHSDICGSIRACRSPQLFAAYRVLLRLPVPRHSPCALISLTIFFNDPELCFVSRLKNLLQYFYLAYISVCVSLILVFLIAFTCFLYSIFKILSLKQFSLLQQTIVFCLRFPYFLVGTSGLEPPTSRLSGVRSNHLSYAPI